MDNPSRRTGLAGNTGDVHRRPGAAARIVRYARKRAGLSQRALGERAGVPQATVGRIEAGLTQPKLETVLLLVNACGFELDLELRRGDGVDRTLFNRDDGMTIARRIQIAAESGTRLDRLMEAIKVPAGD